MPPESPQQLSLDGVEHTVRSEWVNGLRAAALALLLCCLAYGAWRLSQSSTGADPFLYFLPTVVAAAWFGELTGAAVAAGVALAVLLTAEPNGVHSTFGTAQYVEAVVYPVIGAAVAWPRLATRRAQNQLRRSWEIASTITRSSKDGICAVDGRGYILFLNAAAERALGWRDAEVRKRNLHSLIHRCEGQDCRLRNTWGKNASEHVEDDRFITRSGEFLPVSFSSVPLRTGGRPAGAIISFRDMTEHLRQQEVLQRTQDQYAALIKTSPDSVIITDIYNFVLMASRRAAELYGFENPDSMVGINAMELIAEGDRVRAARDKRKMMEQGAIRDIEYLARRVDGSTFPVEVSSSAILNQAGHPEALITVARDRTEQKQAERSARESDACVALQYAATAALAESTSLGDAIPKILQTVCQGAGWDVGAFWSPGRQEEGMRCRYIWQAPKLQLPHFDPLTREVTLSRNTDLPGRVWFTSRPQWIEDVVTDPTFTRALAASKDGLHAAFAVPVSAEGSVQGVLEFFSREVRPRSPELMEMMTKLSGQIGYFIKRRQAEEELERAAYHDPLTGLANRLLFKGRVDRAILASWPDDRSFALLLMDLNKFKQVNDTYGHQYGDIILQKSAIRLRHTLRDSDTVARLGGDEFAVLLPASDVQGACIVARKIVDALTQPIMADSYTFHIGTSIGIALYPHHGEDTNTLLHHADVAMYGAKSGGGGYRVYDEDQEEAFDKRKGTA